MPKARYFVHLGSYDRIGYYPASARKSFRHNTGCWRQSEWDRTYLTSFGEVMTPTLMLDAPLSRTMTGERFMIVAIGV